MASIPAAGKHRWRALEGVWIALALATAMLSMTAREAEAAKLHFGTQDYLNHLQDVTITGREGEALALGHKYSHHSFIMPYMMTDEGYVLIVKGKMSYYKLDDGMIKDLQGKGLLPNPLPPYEFGLFDYLFGYLAWIVLGGLAIGGMWSAFKGGRAKKADAIIETAVEHGRAGRSVEAIAGFTSAIKLAPKNGLAYFNRGVAYSNAGQLDKAISDYTTLIRLSPKSSDGFVLRAFANQKKGDHDRAITDFGSAMRLEPDHVTAHLGRSQSFRHKAAWPQAIADANRLVELAPDAEAAYTNRAEIYEAQGAATPAAADRAMAARLGQPPPAQAPEQTAAQTAAQPPPFGPLTI